MADRQTTQTTTFRPWGLQSYFRVTERSV